MKAIDKKYFSAMKEVEMDNCASASFVSSERRQSSPSYSNKWYYWTAEEKAFDLSGDLEPFVDLCRSDTGLASAIGMQRALADKRGPRTGNEKCVYVIGVEGREYAKIGVSADPIERVSDLHGGHYRPLYLYAALFCPTRKSVSIEQEVLERATLQGIRMNGEWINADPRTVLMMALESARDGKWPVCDAQTWFNNMVRRTKALAKSKYAANGRSLAA